jgi:hypothetical protein
MEITNNINTTNPIGAYEHIVLLIWLVYDDDRLRVGPIPTICRPTICGERSTMHPGLVRHNSISTDGWHSLSMFFCGHDGRDRRDGAKGFWITRAYENDQITIGEPHIHSDELLKPMNDHPIVGVEAMRCRRPLLYIVFAVLGDGWLLAKLDHRLEGCCLTWTVLE